MTPAPSPALMSRARTTSRRLVCIDLLFILSCCTGSLIADATSAKVALAIDTGAGNPRSSEGKGGGASRQQRQNNNGGNDPNVSQDNQRDSAQQHLENFFDNLLKLQYHYGNDVITVRDATEIYPILGQTYDASMGDCPFEYIPWQRGRPEGTEEDGSMPSSEETPQYRKMDARPRPCFTPVVTIHDRIANSWGVPPHQSFNEELPEVVLVGGLGSPEEMDLSGPSSILETIRLLLECARCEALSPWVNVDGNEDDSANANGVDEKVENAEIEEQDDELLGIDDAFDDNGDGNDSSKAPYTNAIQCRKDLAAQQIDDLTRKWLARLVATRRLVAIPIADVAGFYKRLADVEGIKAPDAQPGDGQGSPGAECDFPLPFRRNPSPNGLSAASTCMTTFPARMLNELFHSHAFQLGLSFHGANEQEPSNHVPWVVVPSWNAPGSVATSDERAMIDIARAYAGFGTLANDVRIDHAQDMEGCNGSTLPHFAFAAGLVEGGAGVNSEGSLWMDQCQCDADEAHSDNACTYPSDRTGVYDGSSLRAIVAKAVSEPVKWSPASIATLPGFDSSYDPTSFHNNQQQYVWELNSLGKNIRMSLLATELVEPWTAVRSIAGVELKDDDVLPLTPRVPGACTHTRAMQMPESSLMGNVTVTWTVGGALSVDETAIMYGKWNVLDKKIFDCVTQPTKQELDAFFSILRDFEVMEGENEEEMKEDVSFTPVQSGVTRWHSFINGDATMTTPVPPPEASFTVSLDLTHYQVGDVIAIYALARTDQVWVSGESQTPAQTNVVNARSNAQWSHIHADSADGGSLIKGRLDWFSVPVTIEIGPAPGFFEGNEPVEMSVRVSDEGYQPVEGYELRTIAYALFMAVVVIAITFSCVFCREERDGTDIFSIWSEHRRIDKQKISMDEFFSETELTMINMN